MTIDLAAAAAVRDARINVAALHAELVSAGLVAWTSGNISGRVPGTDLIVIKPSGVAYPDLTPESMVVCDLDGRVVDGELSPSSDTATHAYVYRHRPDVGGVVHTHSPYATAWAAETGVPYQTSRETLMARGFAPAPIDAGVIAEQQHTVDVYVAEGVLPVHYDAALGFDASFNI